MVDKDLFRLLGHNKKYVIYVVILMIVGLIANLGITACICSGISIAINKGAAIDFLIPILIALVAILIRYCTTRLVGDLKDKIGREVKKDIRKRTYDKILKLGVKSTDEMSMAGLTQVSIEGVEQLDLYYSAYLPQFFFSMIAPFIIFGVTIGINWIYALVLLALIPIIPVSIILVSKYAKKIFNKYWGIYTSMGDEFLDSMQGLKELKIFKADKKRHEYINYKAEEFRKVTMKVLVMQLASITIMDLVAFGGAGIGTAIAITGLFGDVSVTASLIANTLFLILVAVEFFLPLRNLGSSFHVAMNGASAGKKIIQLLDMKDPVWGDKKVINTNLNLNNLTFSYDGKRDVLKNVSLQFPEKGMTAIVGESGCGKSTIVNMLIGAYRPKCGEVKISNELIENISRKSFYSHLAVVSYNTYVFNDTIRNNFKLAKEDVKDQEIWDALNKVNLDKFIIENGGLDKIIIEDANNISGGQKQRLALAVNLVADKDIYIFDEATSNIDVESEVIIMKNVREMANKKNVIVISHRLENVVIADNIYFMEDGKIKENGTHKELMSKNGGYAKLYTTQKELEEGYKNIVNNRSTIKQNKFITEVEA